ncbi:MAG: diguanylate cyclase [Burkholderiales bacterium]|nr:diguanylate cyclase [Burkholderiales bacterium]
MSLRLKFNLILIAVFALSLIGAAMYYNGYLERNAINEVRNNSQVLMETALAIRSYTTDEIKPHLDPMNAQRFLPQTVPAFAATETLRRLRDKFPAYEYKEAVLNPTNTRDRANEWERSLIEKFRADPSQTEFTGTHGEGIQRAVYVARPIVIKQAQCLACHSEPAAAPASMLSVYGEKNGFGWQLNETVGMQLVKLPMLYPIEKARETFYAFMASLLTIFVLTFIALNSSLSGLVIEPMARLNRKLEDLATRDFLTDLVNRRRFFEQLASAMADSRVHNTGLSVVMFDIDLFKRINDTFGHDSGDVVLKNTALRVRELLRSSDSAARFGGEEFMILLRETRIDAAMAIAEAVRAKIANVPFDRVGTVSASFGVAEWDHREEARELIDRADRALYVAKQTGRNRVVRAEPAPAIANAGSRPA